MYVEYLWVKNENKVSAGDGVLDRFWPTATIELFYPSYMPTCKFFAHIHSRTRAVFRHNPGHAIIHYARTSRRIGEMFYLFYIYTQEGGKPSLKGGLGGGKRFLTQE